VTGDDQWRAWLDFGRPPHFNLAGPAVRQRSTQRLIELYFDLLMEIRPSVAVGIGAFDASFSSEMKRRLPEIHAVAFKVTRTISPPAAPRRSTPESSTGIRRSLT
jgi:hypothetical protein